LRQQAGGEIAAGDDRATGIHLDQAADAAVTARAAQAHGYGAGEPETARNRPRHREPASATTAADRLEQDTFGVIASRDNVEVAIHIDVAAIAAAGAFAAKCDTDRAKRTQREV